MVVGWVGPADDVVVALEVGGEEEAVTVSVGAEHFFVESARAADRSAEVHLLMRHVAATDLNSFVHTQAMSFSPAQPCV